ncbi:MAG TPA: energy-coupling factor ABC transporter ATP-binding protein [bacterium]|nr:energy-coupling factor ABC transporter ATP-binding protein [bacterium]HOL46896.1 energy-coupling factor ABC transporter ATP-binding protein [bacterium]HPQ18342.1 energy-coupling factor ABC transporter ATP-binding protein [bacterium]
MDAEKIICLKNIFFGFKANNIFIRNFDLELLKNEKLGLIGHTGSGKTTILHIIMGLLKPIQGEVIIFEKKRKTEDDFLEVRQKIGLLFQNSDEQLFCPSVIEDIAFGPLNLHYNNREYVKRKVNEIIKKFDLEELKNRYVTDLSYGEKKIVALAGIFAMEPEVLLLDEPTNGLDKEHTKKIIELIKKEVKTCIIVSHNQEFINELCNRKIVLNN